MKQAFEFRLSFVLWLCIASASSVGAERRFIMMPDSPPDTFMCPAHAHGTVDQAMSEAKRIRAEWHSDSPFCMWVCRANQVATLEKFAPLADRVFVTPFLLADSEDA